MGSFPLMAEQLVGTTPPSSLAPQTLLFILGPGTWWHLSGAWAVQWSFFTSAPHILTWDRNQIPKVLGEKIFMTLHKNCQTIKKLYWHHRYAGTPCCWRTCHLYDYVGMLQSHPSDRIHAPTQRLCSTKRSCTSVPECTRLGPPKV